MTQLVRLASVAAVAAAGAAVLLLGPGTAGREAEPSPPPDPVAMRLAQAMVDREIPELAPAWPARDVRRWSRRQQGRFPLPRGGNFSGIRWEGPGGPVPLTQAEVVLRHNARCQWLRAERDGRDAATATAVLRVIADWPALSEPGSAAARVVDCDASHSREVAWALRLGLRPSS